MSLWHSNVLPFFMSLVLSSCMYLLCSLVHSFVHSFVRSYVRSFVLSVFLLFRCLHILSFFLYFVGSLFLAFVFRSLCASVLPSLFISVALSFGLSLCRSFFRWFLPPFFRYVFLSLPTYQSSHVAIYLEGFWGRLRLSAVFRGTFRVPVLGLQAFRIWGFPKIGDPDIAP